MIPRIPERVYSQYRTKPKFVDWMAIARKMGGSIYDAAEAVRRSYDIDTAEGVQLDVLGRIIVFDRGFIGQIEMQTAEFDLTDGAECGDENAVFSEARVSNDSAMSDGLFRLAIKSKITKNNGDATVESIIGQMVSLVGASFVRINDPGNMSFTIEFAGDITPLQRWALFNANLIQIPQGVLFGGFFELTNFIEFDDDEHEFGDPEAMFSDFHGA